jgi:hypothetical protein
VMLAILIRHPEPGNVGVLVLLTVFVAIGVGMLLTAIQLAFRHAVILASRDSLVFTQTGPIRKSKYQWKSEELTAIRCANSSAEVNHQPLKELQVETRGKKRGLLTGRNEDELMWLASVLRNFYRVRP